MPKADGFDQPHTMSFHSALTNRTPFAAAKMVLPDPQGQEAVLIVVRAGFDVDAGGAIRLNQPQPPIGWTDVPFAPERAARSSVRHEGDIALGKPRVDILVRAEAHCPVGRLMTSLDVAFAFAGVTKHLRVTGDRDWRASVLGRKPSSPRPFARMELVYERAFGGTTFSNAQSDIEHVEQRNPVGVGFRGARSADPAVASDLPNLEYAGEALDSPDGDIRPAGIGIVGRGWLPRRTLAGTYDEAWQDRRWPLLPEDFDGAFYQCAPMDQQIASIVGGESVRLVGLTAAGDWRFRLPTLRVPITLMFDRETRTESLRVDTVDIDAIAGTLSMAMRLSVRTRRNQGLLREIVVGVPTAGYLRAAAAGKRFVDWGRPVPASTYVDVDQ